MDRVPREQAIFYPKDSFMNQLFGLALLNFGLSLGAQILTQKAKSFEMADNSPQSYELFYE